MTPDRESIRAALAHIPADDRELWLRIGMALQSEFPGDEGLALFDEWSQRGDSYDARAVRDTWRSFKPGKVTIGTLLHEAKARGFKGKAQPVAVPPDEAERIKRERAQRRAQEEAQYRARADAAAQEAARMWAEASEEGRSPYLERKGVRGHGVRYLADGTLLVPARNAAGELVNLQRIAPSKPTEAEARRGLREKRFLPGGRKSATWHMLGDPAGAAVLLLAEGYATAASLHEATGHPAAVGWDAGNLAKVAQALAELFPGASLVVAGDDDRMTEAGGGGNPGRKGAETAARAGRGLAVFPAFPEGASDGATDWNDLAALVGLGEVAAQIAAAVAAHQAGALPEPKPRSASRKARRGAESPPGGAEVPPEPENGASGPPEDGAALFDRFKLSGEGVLYSDHDEGGRGRLLWVCSRLAVTARTRDADGDGWGYLLEFDDPTGKARTWAMPARMLAGDGSEYRATLLGMGLRIAAGTKARNLLTQYLQTRQPDEVAQCTDRIGWHGASFVLPRETILRPAGTDGEAPERIVYQADGASENPFRVRGTLDAWRAKVAAPCVGNSRLTFSVSSAFAGPLLRPAGLDSGGFHLRGSSSCGKTTALRLAASVYGGANYLQRWRATDNALEAVAAQHCDGLLILDELAQVDPRTAGECAYMLANETSKARSTRTGQTRQRLTWRLLFLSAGEIGLAAHMAEGGKRAHAGQELRMVDIPAEVVPGSVFEDTHGHDGGAPFALYLAKASEAQHGHAGRAWLAWCVEHADSLRERTREAVERLAALWVPEAASGQVHRVGRRFALVAAAGELATEAGVTGWPAGAATAAARDCFHAWINARPGGAGSAEEAAMLAQVRRWLQLNGAGRFTWWHRALDDRAPDKGMRAGYRRLMTPEGKPVKTDSDHMAEFGETMRPSDAAESVVEHFVFPEVFDAEVCEGFDAQAVKRLLRERGHLLPEKGRPFDCKPRLPGMGPTRCYRVAASIFDGGDGE